jgi:hypothetical protein
MNSRIGLSVFTVVFVGLVAVSLMAGAAKQNLDMDDSTGFGRNVECSTPKNGIPGDMIRMAAILDAAEYLVDLNAHAKRETIEEGDNSGMVPVNSKATSVPFGPEYLVGVNEHSKREKLNELGNFTGEYTLVGVISIYSNEARDIIVEVNYFPLGDFTGEHGAVYADSEQTMGGGAVEPNPEAVVTDYTDEDGNLLSNEDYYKSVNRWPKQKRQTIVPDTFTLPDAGKWMWIEKEYGSGREWYYVQPSFEGSRRAGSGQG